MNKAEYDFKCNIDYYNEDSNKNKASAADMMQEDIEKGLKGKRVYQREKVVNDNKGILQMLLGTEGREIIQNMMPEESGEGSWNGCLQEDTEEARELLKKIKNLLMSNDSVNRSLAFQLLRGLGANSEIIDYIVTKMETQKEFLIQSLQQSLPKKITERITKLDISGCEVTILPRVIQRFTNLKKLDCSKNDILELPYWIGDLRNLEILDCSQNEYLNELPQEITNLINLKELSCGRSRIRNFPHGMKEMINLKRVYCVVGDKLSVFTKQDMRKDFPDGCEVRL